MEVVDDPQTDDGICWLPDGESFVIRPKSFHKTLDHFFQGSKLFSFTRKLYRYGFRKIVTSPDCDVEDLVFSHPYFKKDKHQLLQFVTGSSKQMYCTQAIKGQSTCSNSSANPSKYVPVNKSLPQSEKLSMIKNPTSSRPRLPANTQPVMSQPVRVASTALIHPVTGRSRCLPLPTSSHPQIVIASPHNQHHHPSASLTTAMMCRGMNMNNQSMRAPLLARERAQQQRLQQASRMLQATQGLQLVGGGGGGRQSLPGVHQNQLLDLLIQKRLSELQGTHSRFP